MSLHEPPPSLRERTANAVDASRTAGAGRRVLREELGRNLATGAAAGVFLGLVGAFGSGDGPLPVRLSYWVGLCVLGSLAGTGITATAMRAGQLAARPWLVELLAFAAVTAVLTPVVWAATELVFGGWWPPRLEMLPWFAAPVAIVTGAVTALTFLLNRAPVVTHAAVEGRLEPVPPVRFLERLPPRLRGAQLFAVQSEDHYLRLYTSRGQGLILLRLSDALAELDGLEGAQTHRSWWVARDGFESAERADGRAMLKLRDGAEAPVSRTYARALRQAGWF